MNVTGASLPRNAPGGELVAALRLITATMQEPRRALV